MASSRLPTLADFAEAEHHVLEDLTIETTGISAAFAGMSQQPSEISDVIVIRDRARGRLTTVTLYAEAWVDIEVERRGRRPKHQRIDLRFLDAVPEMTRHYPVRLLKSAGIAAALTALCAIPAGFGWLSAWSVPAAIAAGSVTLAMLLAVYYLSHEKIVFRTLHGRAAAIRFGAGLGTIRHFRRLVPRLIEAIADGAETLTDETAVYLRAEMREHYRLRGDGIISEDECAASTDLILGEFDGPL